MEIIPKLPALVEQANKMVDTDLSIGDMMDLAQALHGMMEKQGGLHAAMVPGLPEYIDGVSYWIPDITDLRNAGRGNDGPLPPRRRTHGSRICT